MLIKNINKIKENVHIILDNEEKVILRYEVFLKNGFRKGDQINHNDISMLIRQNQLFYIKESAFRFLGRRLHSAKELEKKLQSKKYDKELISEIIIELKDNLYVDDERFAREYAEEKLNKKMLGVNRVKMELLGKGVSREIINSVLNENSDSDEIENAMKLAEKRLNAMRGRSLDKLKINQRLYSYLASKGFKYEIIRTVLDRLEY